MPPINRYDSPAQYTPINTYVPIPFEQMAQASAYRNKQADQVLGYELELADQAVASGLPYMRVPGTDELIDVSQQSGLSAAKKWIDDYNMRLQTIADRTGTMDMSDPVYRKEVLKMAKELKDAKSQTGILGKSEKNLQAWKMMQNTINKNPDIESNPWLANNMIQHLRDFQSGNVSELDPSIGIQKYEDLSLLTDDLIRGIASEYGNNLDRVSDTKISNTALNYLPQSRIGERIREINNFTYNEAIRSGATPEAAAAAAAKKSSEIYNNLIKGAINKYKSSKYQATKSGFGGFDFSDMNPWETQTSNLPNIKVANNDDLKLPTEGLFGGEDGNTWSVWGVKTQKQKEQEKDKPAFIGDDEEAKSNLMKVREEKINAEMEKVGVDPTRMTPEKFVPVYNSAVDALNQQGLLVKATTEEAAQQNIRNITNSLSSSNFYIPNQQGFVGGSDKTQKSTSFEDAAKSLGYKGTKGRDAFKEQLQNATDARFIFDGPEAGMFAVEIMDGNNKPTTVLISGGNELETATAPVWNVMNNFRNLDDTPWLAGRDANGNPIYRRVKPVLNTAFNQFEPIIQQVISDKEYNPTDIPKDLNWNIATGTSGAPLTIENMIQQTMNNLKNDPVVGFNFNWYDAPKRADAPFNMDPAMFFFMQQVLNQ